MQILNTAGENQGKEEIDYKLYERVTADYKANGKMMPGVKTLKIQLELYKWLLT